VKGGKDKILKKRKRTELPTKVDVSSDEENKEVDPMSIPYEPMSAFADQTDKKWKNR
jgi:hypothetical protein